MRRPVRIVKQPKAQSGFEIRMNAGMGFNANQLSWPVMAGEFSAPETEVNNTLKPTDWDKANLEAEKGETVVTNLNHDGIPEHYKIGGKRHYEGGTPLNLPPNSFIFSRDRSMKIKDEEILKMFGMAANKKGYTPADIAKQYDINKFRKILADPDSEDLQRETAEMMITNYNLKLGKLALVQESLKGFPQGMPMISNPYLQSMNINPEELAQTQAQPDESGEEDVARYGKQVRRNLPKHQTTGKVDADANGISDFIQAPGLNTTGTSSGSLVVKSKGPGLGGLFKNPKKAMETFMSGEQFATNLANLDEKQAAEKDLENKFAVTNLMSSVGENKGWNVRDNYAGVQYDPINTGQQTLTPGAASQQPGMNIVKYGGQGDLPRAQLGNLGNIPNFRMNGNIGGSGFFGPRSRMVGMRYNQDKGIYEAVNRKGEVIGFFNAGQGQGQGSFGNTGSSIYGTSGNTGEEVTTTTKKKVKKQVIPEGSMKDVIKRNDYKTDAEYEDARDKAFADAGGKKTIYTQDKDGKYYTVGESPMFDGNKDIDKQLGYLKEQFSDPKMAKALREKMIAASNDGNKLKKNKTEIQQMLNDPNTTDQQIVDQFLELNTRNRKVNDLIQGSYSCYDNATGKWKGGKGCDDKIGKKYASLDAAAQAAGVPMGDAKNKTLQQLSYIGYDDLLNDAEAGKIKDVDVANKLKNFKKEQFGVNDEGLGSGKNKGQVSAADSFYTNTTAGQVAGITGKKRKEDLLADTEVEEDVITKGKKAAEYAGQMGPSPRFIQDIMKSGNAFGQWAGLKKYMPYGPTPKSTLIQGEYLDPNRQLAANSEIAANTLQNLGAFQGAQGLSSRASQIFGQTARGAADVLSQYNNQNVGIANSLAAQNANILNQDSIRRTGLAKQLYDENTLANQQFDNSRRQGMENMVNQWVSGETNAANAYNMNQMFPQYHTYPEFGGRIGFTNGRPITPDASGKGSFLNKYKEYQDILGSGTDANVIWNLVKNDLGTANNSEVDPDYIKAMAATMKGMGNPIRQRYDNS